MLRLATDIKHRYRHLQVQNSVWIDAEMYNIYSRTLHTMLKNTKVVLKFKLNDHIANN